jgi:hypothetical protein
LRRGRRGWEGVKMEKRGGGMGGKADEKPEEKQDRDETDGWGDMLRKIRSGVVGD